MIRCIVLLGAALLAGCARAPIAAPPNVAPLSYPPSAAARVVRIALAEWRDWGAVTREAWVPADPAPPRESEPDNFPRVLAYWRAVEDDENAIRDNRPLYAAALAGLSQAGLWSEPAWSAAFVSYVFRAAGIDAREFPPNATHAFYLDALTTDAAAFPAAAPFVPRQPADYSPRPGDMVCFDRSRAPLRSWSDRPADQGRARPMHCDIVVATPAGFVEVVGGNVSDSVTMTRYPAAADGRIVPAPPGRIPLLLVMQSRLGRLPPWTTLELAAR